MTEISGYTSGGIVLGDHSGSSSLNWADIDFSLVPKLITIGPYIWTPLGGWRKIHSSTEIRRIRSEYHRRRK